MDIRLISNGHHCNPAPACKPGNRSGKAPATLLFVYGTLMRGQPAHRLMREARLLGRAQTPPGFMLYYLGPYPAAVRRGHGRVRGELYAVPLTLLRQLDAYENCPREYQRRLIQAARGPAWIYLYLHLPRCGHRLWHGDWRRRRQ
ncbi:MAG: gamma-glutamylcyclotransferase family protein [Halothiobacillaceae bacterium]